VPTGRCDHMVATTTELRDELVRDLGMPVSQLTSIPKSIDRQAYQGLGVSAFQPASRQSCMPARCPTRTLAPRSAHSVYSMIRQFSSTLRGTLLCRNPERELQLLIQQLRLQLPPQPPPKITAAALAHVT
jgi:hypothetical protein